VIIRRIRIDVLSRFFEDYIIYSHVATQEAAAPCGRSGRDKIPKQAPAARQAAHLERSPANRRSKRFLLNTEVETEHRRRPVTVVLSAFLCALCRHERPRRDRGMPKRN
jgi:hypothetical protein